MTTDFDPYFQWLGIPPERQPPTHYALLGLEDFESDRQKINAAADSRLQYLRDFQTGPRGKLSQQLVNEIARAKLCLVNAEAKTAYDQRLKRERAPIAPPIVKTGLAPPPLTDANALSAFEIKTADEKIETTSSEDAADSEQTADDQQPVAAVPFYRRRWFPFAALSAVSLLAVSIWLIGWTIVPMFRSTDLAHQDSEDLVEKQTKRDGITTSVFAKGEQIDYPAGIRPQGQLYVLNAANAELTGALTSEKLGGRDVLSGWKLADDRATWKLSVPFPGFYRTELHYSATNMAKGDSILLSVADWKKSHTLRQTASETELVTDELMVLFNKKGTFELHVSPESVDGEFHLHEIRLVPRK